MKILLVSNQRLNAQGVGNPIMYSMRNAIAQDRRIDKVTFLPFCNSVSSLCEIRSAAKDYDVVHIHFGGMYALMIRLILVGLKTKKFITFHGTDIHAKALKTTKSLKDKIKIRINQKVSFLSIYLFDKCGFVSEGMMSYVPKCLNHQLQRKSFLQPLGVDYESFVPMEVGRAQNYLGLKTGHYVLFSDISNTRIKRRDIAEAIVEELGSPYQLLIMSGVSPKEVPFYINASDFALLTSDEEGSPNIIREVLSLNRPFFSVDVGDAERQLHGLVNSSIISRVPQEASRIIGLKINLPYIDNTRESKREILDFVSVSKRIVDLYEKEVL